jgi:hypothetical protein
MVVEHALAALPCSPPLLVCACVARGGGGGSTSPCAPIMCVFCTIMTPLRSLSLP